MNRISVRIILIIILAGVLSYSFRSQCVAANNKQQRNTSEYKIDTWGIDEGLPQSSVNAILQTRDGFIWLGTYGGLVRFDGINFVVYNRGNTPSMSSDRILALMEDTSGTMWIGTENGGVMTLRNGIFSSYTTKEGLADDRVDVLLQDSSGSVWVNNISGNITRYFKGTFRTYDIGVSLGTYFSLSAQGALQCLYDEITFVFESEQFVPYFQHPIYNRLFSVPPVWDNKGNFWICRDGKVLSCFKDGKEMKRVSIPENLHIMVERNMKFDNDGNLWMLSMGGAVRFDGTSFRLYSTNDGLSANQVISLLIDREGNCWFGTLTSGLNRFRKKMFTVVTSKEKEAINNITSISHLHEGTIIFGINCNGFKLWKDNSFLSTSPYPTNVNPCVWSVFEDSRRTLWLGTWGNGLYKCQVSSNGTISLPQEVKSVSGRTVVASYEDRACIMWFGTVDKGVFMVDGDSTKNFTTKNGLSNNDVRAILQDSRKAMWFGTANGLNKLSNGEIKIFTISDGLKSNSIRAIYEDKEKILWVGTYGGGLCRIENETIVSFTTEEGLFDNLVSHIIEDDDGNFWMGCNRGISRVSKQELHEVAQGKRTSVNAVSFGKDYGLLNVETNGGFQPNALKSSDGRIWFPTVEGVAWLDPNDVRLNTTKIPVHIDYVEVDQKQLEHSPTITIGPDQHNLVIGYTAPSFIESKKVRFKYMLHGYDQTWVDVKTRREAYYTKLPQGTYTFTVIAANSDGVWNETGASFTLIVVPPFWMTWWFRGIGIALFLSFGPMFYFYRVRKLQREKAMQEQFSRNLLSNVEQERKRIATELHDSLGQNLLVIKNRSVFGLRQLSEVQKVKEQLEGISQGVSDSLKELRHIAYNLRPFELDRLGLTSALHGMIDKVRESSTVNIILTLDDIKGVVPKDEEINVFRIVQEGLNNILKHSEATQAEVQIKTNRQVLSINIVDNGKGFDIGKLNRANEKHGLGISGLEERVRMLGGEMKLTSVSGGGTTVDITIPITNRIS